MAYDGNENERIGLDGRVGRFTDNPYVPGKERSPIERSCGAEPSLRGARDNTQVLPLGDWGRAGARPLVFPPWHKLISCG